MGQLSARCAGGAVVRSVDQVEVAEHGSSRLSIVDSRCVSWDVETAVLGDGAAAGPGELGALESRAAAGHGASLELGGVRAWRRMCILFPLAASAVRAGTDARGFEHTG